jgi:intracellular septation protein A
MIKLFILANYCLSSSASLRKADIVLSNLALAFAKATIISSEATIVSFKATIVSFKAAIIGEGGSS